MQYFSSYFTSCLVLLLIELIENGEQGWAVTFITRDYFLVHVKIIIMWVCGHLEADFRGSVHITYSTATDYIKQPIFCFYICKNWL